MKFKTGLLSFLGLMIVCSTNVFAEENHKKPPMYEKFAPQNESLCPPEYKDVTSEATICDALDKLKGTVGDFSRSAILGENLSEKPIKVEFKELSSLRPQYANYDALGLKKKKQLYIYINEKHRNAPPEAIAALLSHEALHQDEYNSVNEETYAWTMEATVWAELCRKNPALRKEKMSSLASRENMLLKMLENANYSNILIKNTVVNHPGYQNLPVKSPGFD